MSQFSGTVTMLEQSQGLEYSNIIFCILFYPLVIYS